MHPQKSREKSSGRVRYTNGCMRWLRLVGFLKLQVSFAEYRLFCRALLQKRLIILRSLLIVATPYMCAADPTWGDIFECCFKAQSSQLERLFCHVSAKRDVRALSFERAFEDITPNGIGCTFIQGWRSTAFFLL